MGKINLAIVDKAPIFRKIALGSWNTVGDPSVYGLVELDMSQVQLFMKEQEDLHKVKITPAHIVGKAIAQVMQQRPEINGMLRFGRIYLRKDIDIFFQVNVPGKGNTHEERVKHSSLSGAVIRQADKINVVEIARSLRDRAEKIRDGQDRETGDALKTFAAMPWRAVKWVLNLTSLFNYDFNLNMTALGIPKDPFGSVMITNVGSLGIEQAWAPLVPYTRVPLLLTLGAIKDRAWVVNGKIEVRPIMKIGVTFDHRFMDGVHAAAMGKHFTECFENPWKYLL